MASSASEAAKAVNSLLGCSANDQQALIEVLEEYFTTPDENDLENDSDDDSIPKDSSFELESEAYLEPEDPEPSLDPDLASVINTEERVREAMQGVTRVTDEITITNLTTDDFEEKQVTEFLAKECGCKRECSRQFTTEHIKAVRQSCAELTRLELDMAILGQLMACVNNSTTVSTEARHREADRVKAYSIYTHQGKQVCPTMFKFLHGIGDSRFKNLSKNIRENGLIPRVHGNTNRRPKHALSFDSIQHVVQFLYTYAEQHAILLPGRIPGYSRTDLQLLPSSQSKRAIWRVYHLAVQSDIVHAIAYSTFCYLWRTLVPSVLVMKPRSDLCWQCQQNSTAIVRASNSADKTATISDALEHLCIVKKERSNYKAVCEECRHMVHDFFGKDDFKPPPPHSQVPSNSNNIKVHYSFDYAQQVHYPSDPLQPGPIYFLTPRKCSVFGVNCEAIPRQVNFLTDEAGDCGKGANAVISRLHYFFEHHGLGEKHVYLHADNCSGQNKNNSMMQYLLWRTLTNRHTTITLSFLPVGHTKFSPDWCFGLFKRQFRRTKIGSLCDIAQSVNTSADCNFAKLVSREDGSTIVPTLDWSDFFAPQTKKISGIKKLQPFRFTSASPGIVFVKERCDSEETSIPLLKGPWSLDDDNLPRNITPNGLSGDRQWYLYETIRPFVPEGDRDTVCPLPSVPKNTSRRGTPTPDDLPLPKRRRVCGVCRCEGHDRRSCPDNREN